MALQPSDHVQDTHLKSLLDVVFENSQKQLVQLRNDLAKEPKKLTQKEREFMFRECSKLESIGNLQAKLDEYRALNSSSNVIQKAKESAAANGSDKLGNHLRATGQLKLGPKWQAHHIVCGRHGSHAAARFKLFAYIGINDPHNGCWLPLQHKYATGTVQPHAVGHTYLHTDKYAAWVEREIVPAAGKDSLIMRLRSIRMKLIDARNLPDVLTEKGKQDLRTSH
ncbi:MAG: AHH domain-containing protein [Pseudomonadota bacterium]